MNLLARVSWAAFWTVFVLLCAVAMYEAFLRYEYSASGGTITRVDHLTGTSCQMPCTESPSPGPN